MKRRALPPDEGGGGGGGGEPGISSSSHDRFTCDSMPPSTRNLNNDCARAARIASGEPLARYGSGNVPQPQWGRPTPTALIYPYRPGCVSTATINLMAIVVRPIWVTIRDGPWTSHPLPDRAKLVRRARPTTTRCRAPGRSTPNVFERRSNDIVAIIIGGGCPC